MLDLYLQLVKSSNKYIASQLSGPLLRDEYTAMSKRFEEIVQKMNNHEEVPIVIEFLIKEFTHATQTQTKWYVPNHRKNLVKLFKEVNLDTYESLVARFITGGHSKQFYRFNLR